MFHDSTIRLNFFDLFCQPWFWAAFAGWMMAQFIKMLIAIPKLRALDFSFFVSTGGMPSAHSALVTALTTSLGLTLGFDAPIFMTALVFATITMFDAATVRQAAGLQAKVLNKMVYQIFKEHRFTAAPLRELLGHTRTEVFFGIVTGVIMGICVVELFLQQGWFTIAQ